MNSPHKVPNPQKRPAHYSQPQRRRKKGRKNEKEASHLCSSSSSSLPSTISSSNSLLQLPPFRYLSPLAESSPSSNQLDRQRGKVKGELTSPSHHRTRQKNTTNISDNNLESCSEEIGKDFSIFSPDRRATATATVNHKKITAQPTILLTGFRTGNLVSEPGDLISGLADPVSGLTDPVSK